MSLLKFNKLFRNQNQKGFSLVELMIALTILAFFAVGIVSAFSGAFQAMADSKHRTVAINLAQKEIEEIRNTPNREEYPFYKKEEPLLIDGIEYTIIKVASERDGEGSEEKAENVADFFVTVSWYNRNGVQNDVRLATLVYNLKTKIEELPELSKIILSADPTEMICCQEDQISILTAEVFDKEGGRLVPSGTPVSFTTNAEGSLKRDYGLTDSIGVATTELTIKSINPATATASAGATKSNTVTVSCNAVPYEIIVSANKSTMVPGETQIITATVKDSCGNNLSNKTGQVTVTFTTDYGYFDNSPSTKTKNISTVNGVATIRLHMNNSGENATITGTVTPKEGDLFYEPLIDSVEVFCSDYSIAITAQPSTIFPNETSLITVTLAQASGQIPSGQLITFNTNIGTLSATSKTIDSTGKAYVNISNVPGSKTATITAEYLVPNAGGRTVSASTDVKSVQFRLTVEANPTSIIPDGSSTITATLTDYQGNPARDHLINFFTTEGTLDGYSVYTDSSGKARSVLSGLTAGLKADITAALSAADGINETVSVTCIDYVLTLTANPANITAGGTSTITATLKNYRGVAQSYKSVTFTTDIGTFSNNQKTFTANTNQNGVATATLTINTSGTTATITATSEGAVATTTVTCTNIYIALATPSNISLSNGRRDIRFDLRLYGGPLTVNRVRAEWTDISGSPTPSRYENIWIRTRTGTGNWSTETLIYDGSTNNNGRVRNLNSNVTIPRDASIRIRMRFSGAINSTTGWNGTRRLIFTFSPEDPNADNYRVEFDIPTS